MTKRKQGPRTCLSRLVLNFVSWNLRNFSSETFNTEIIAYWWSITNTARIKTTWSKNQFELQHSVFDCLQATTNAVIYIIPYNGSYPYNHVVCFSKHTRTTFGKRLNRHDVHRYTLYMNDNKHIKVFLRSNQEMYPAGLKAWNDQRFLGIWMQECVDKNEECEGKSYY